MVQIKRGIQSEWNKVGNLSVQLKILKISFMKYATSSLRIYYGRKTEEIRHAIQKMNLIDYEDALRSYNYSNSVP